MYNVYKYSFFNRLVLAMVIFSFFTVANTAIYAGNPAVILADSQEQIIERLKSLPDDQLESFRDEEGNTVLHLALKYNKNDFAEVILIKHPNLVTKINFKEEYPLSIADKCRNTEGIKLLIKAQINTNVIIRDNEGNTVIHLAMKYSMNDLAKTFLTWADFTNFKKESPIDVAGKYGNTEGVKLLTNFKNLKALRDTGLNSFRDEEGNTSLHLALKCNMNDLAETILTKYPDLINIKNSKQENPIDVADKCGNTEGVKILKSFKDEDGNTALHLALKDGNNALAEAILAKHPYLINIENAKQESPIYIADKYRNTEGVKLCLEYITAKVNASKDFYQIFAKVLGTKPYYLSKDRAKFFNPAEGENADKLVIILNMPDSISTLPEESIYIYPTGLKHFIDNKVPVLVIGNGKHSLSYQIIKKSIEQHVNNFPEKIILIVCGHGNIDQDGDHIIAFDNTRYESKTKNLFSALRDDIFKNKPIEVCLNACHGGGAIKDVNLLPQGSTLLVLSQPDKIVNVDDYMAMFRSNEEENYQDHPEKFSLHHFFKTYLFAMEATNQIPMLAVSGATKKELDYFELLKHPRHNELIESQKKEIVSSLKSYCVVDSNDCEKIILEAINKIKIAHDIDDLKAPVALYRVFCENYWLPDASPENREDDIATNSETDFHLCARKIGSSYEYGDIPNDIAELCKSNPPSRPFFGIALAVLYEINTLLPNTSPEIKQDL